jgi:hypothetical protein
MLHNHKKEVERNVLEKVASAKAIVKQFTQQQTTGETTKDWKANS